MIKLPDDFVAIAYPGYFWSVTDQHLYSIKSGVLKKLKKNKAFYSRAVYYPESFAISHHGKRHYLRVEFLRNLKPTKKTEIYPTVR